MTTFSMAYMVHMCNGITIASYCRRDTQEVGTTRRNIVTGLREEKDKEIADQRDKIVTTEIQYEYVILVGVCAFFSRACSNVMGSTSTV